MDSNTNATNQGVEAWDTSMWLLARDITADENRVENVNHWKSRNGTNGALPSGHHTNGVVATEELVKQMFNNGETSRKNVFHGTAYDREILNGVVSNEDAMYRAGPSEALLKRDRNIDGLSDLHINGNLRVNSNSLPILQEPSNPIFAQSSDSKFGQIRIINVGREHSTQSWETGPNTNGSSHPMTLEPLAIIGMASKFPSGAETESSFWDMLVSKRCASSDFPADRMNIDAFYNVDTNKPNSISLGLDINCVKAMSDQQPGTHS
jgi:hypothetical protein